MADQPDPPDKWRIYEGDDTPDPEPEPPKAPPKAPDGSPKASSPPVVVRPYSAVPKLIAVVVGVAVLGVGIAAAIAIFAAVDTGIGVGGIDAKDPDDFAEAADKLEEERASTEVFWVGLYTDYIILDVPYTDDPTDTRELSFTWRGGDLDEPTKGTASYPNRFDLREIDPGVVDGLCDPVLELAEGAEEDGCYIFISNPGPDGEAWFYTSASDEFGRSYSIQYDKSGREVSRTVP